MANKDWFSDVEPPVLYAIFISVPRETVISRYHMPVPGKQLASSTVDYLVYFSHVVFFHCSNVFVTTMVSKVFSVVVVLGGCIHGSGGL